jgi:DNA polymerase-3 subunit gamma/tau
MSYKVIARKWRPQTFDEIVGQEHVTTTLKNSLTSGRIHHAVLFTGIRGIGKTTAARVLAKALNCERGPTPEPCNRCTACTEITEGRSLDVKEIDGASNRGIDSIRELREGVAFAATRDRYKVYIIDEVHMLTTEAFNALLKTLEEPPPHVVFIFATTELHKVPATIASRCQVFEFKRASIQTLVAHLGRIAAAEGIRTEDDALRLVAREADGSMRDACSLLDQVISFAGESIDAEAVGQVLRSGNRGVLEDLLGAVLAQDPAVALRIFQDTQDRGLPARQVLRDLARHLSDCMRVSLLGRDAALETGLTDAEVSAMARMVGERPPEALAMLLNLLVIASDRAADSRSPDLLAQATIVRASRLGTLTAVEGLVARLEAIAQGRPAPPIPAVPQGSPPARPVAEAPAAYRAPATPGPSRETQSPAPPQGSAAASAARLHAAAGVDPGTHVAQIPPEPAAQTPESVAQTQELPARPREPARTEQEVARLILKHPTVDKVMETFAGEILRVKPE